MAKRSKPIIGDGESMVSDKFRTTPIKSTIKKLRIHRSAILYKCAASSYWQFRVFLEGTREVVARNSDVKIYLERIWRLRVDEMDGKRATVQLPTLEHSAIA